MNNLYHKAAVAFVCTALSFTLGANKEAKAATIILTPITQFGVQDFYPAFGIPSNGTGDIYTNSAGPVVKGTIVEIAWLAEFSMGLFSYAPNTLPKTLISRAILQTGIYLGVSDWELNYPNSPRNLSVFPRTNPGRLGIFGYAGNGVRDLSDFEEGRFLASVDISSSSSGDTLNFDVTSFVQQMSGPRFSISGFSIRALNPGAISLSPNSSGFEPRLIVETVDVAEPVPEPTTIFGSALALSLGGWLKRKKSSQQNKTTPQH